MVGSLLDKKDARKMGDFFGGNAICPHQHFKMEIINRDQISRKQHLNMLATPKGYRFEMSDSDSSDDSMATSGDECTYVTERLADCTCKPSAHRKKRKRRSLKPCDEEKKQLNAFVNDIWCYLTPDVIETLKEMLISEFGMDTRQAEEFILNQKMMSMMKSSCDSQKPLPFFPCPPENGEGPNLTELLAGTLPPCPLPCQPPCPNSPPCPPPCFPCLPCLPPNTPKHRKTKGINKIGITSFWVRDISDILAKKLSDYTEMMLTTKRTKRIKCVAENILNHLCKITGEELKSDSKAHKIMVFVADRLAIWLSNIPCACDMDLKKICEKSNEEKSIEEEIKKINEKKEKEKERKEKSKKKKERDKDKEKKKEPKPKQKQLQSKTSEKKDKFKKEKDDKKKKEKEKERKEKEQKEKEETKKEEKEEVEKEEVEKEEVEKEEVEKEKKETKKGKKGKEGTKKEEKEMEEKEKEEKEKEEKEKEEKEKEVKEKEGPTKEKKGKEEAEEEDKEKEETEKDEKEEEETVKEEKGKGEKKKGKKKKEEKEEEEKEKEEKEKEEKEKEEKEKEEKEKEEKGKEGKEKEEKVKEEKEKEEKEKEEKEMEEGVQVKDEDGKKDKEKEEGDQVKDEDGKKDKEKEVGDQVKDEDGKKDKEKKYKEKDDKIEREKSAEETKKDKETDKYSDRKEERKVEGTRDEGDLKEEREKKDRWEKEKLIKKKVRTSKEVTEEVQTKITFEVKERSAFQINKTLECECGYKISHIPSQTVCKKVKEIRQIGPSREFDMSVGTIPSQKPLSPEYLKEWAVFAEKAVTRAERWREWIGKTCTEAEDRAKLYKEQLIKREELMRWKTDKQRQALRWKMFKTNVTDSAEKWKESYDIARAKKGSNSNKK